MKKDGKIKSWGVSNLDADDMRELDGVPAGKNCISDQVLYHLGSRGIEWALLPYCQKAKIMVMAYSPLGQGPILRKPALKTIADKHGCEPAAIALAWVLRQPGVIAIPKASNPDHVRANMQALDIVLDADDLKALDAAFPPPKRGCAAGYDVIDIGWVERQRPTNGASWSGAPLPLAGRGRGWGDADTTERLTASADIIAMPSCASRLASPRSSPHP